MANARQATITDGLKLHDFRNNLKKNAGVHRCMIMYDDVWLRMAMHDDVS